MRSSRSPSRKFEKRLTNAVYFQWPYARWSQIGGDYIGTDKLKIGELASKTGITKRTIDYYTTLGLLKAERSSSNYRYYHVDAIQQLDYIEKRKDEGLSLEEIRKELIERNAEALDVQELRLKMRDLEQDVSKLIATLDEDEQSKQSITKNITQESLALIKSLALLLH